MAVLLFASLAVLACGPKEKAAVPYDLSFIDAMSVRDHAEINMAVLADSLASHPEVRDLARGTVENLTRELATLKSMRDHWFSGRPEAPNVMEMPGMGSSMRGTQTIRLKHLKDMDFDLRFIDMMIIHHQGQVILAQDALLRSRRREIRDFARHVLDARSAEIAVMDHWISGWAAQTE